MTIGAWALPVSISLCILAAFSCMAILCPHLLPKGLLYEVALADLIIRENVSKRLRSFRYFWWHSITSHLVLGGLPLRNRGHLHDFKKMNIKAVCAVLEDFEASSDTFLSSPLKADDWSSHKIDYLRLSCPDMKAMNLSSLKRAISWIHSQIRRKKKVYLHCKAGRGRSAVIAICYLIYYHKMPLKEAIQRVRRRRSVMILRPCQKALLEEFVNKVNKKLV